MNSNQADLITTLSDCVASLEHVERAAPDLTGYAMRGLRLDKARALIARARGDDPECVYGEFSPVDADLDGRIVTR